MDGRWVCGMIDDEMSGRWDNVIMNGKRGAYAGCANEIHSAAKHCLLTELKSDLGG